MNYGVIILSDNILEINELSGGIGDFKLENINLSIERGTVMGLIGKNGSGKTTLIQTISGLLTRCGGSILINNKPITGNEIEIKNMLGLVLDPMIYMVSLKPKDIAKTWSVFYNNFNYDMFDSLMNRFNLSKDKQLIKYSKGMMNTFNVIMGICHNPDLLILDEPTAGLDPETRYDIIELLHEFMENENKSILFSTHITSDLEKIADYITLMDNGKTLFTKSIIELTDEMFLCRVNKSYLTDELKTYIEGYRKTGNDVDIIIKDKNKFLNIPDVKFNNLTIEDIMMYRMGRSNINELY